MEVLKFNQMLLKYSTVLSTVNLIICGKFWQQTDPLSFSVIVCVVNASRVGRPQLETFLPNVTEFSLRLPDRSTRYKFFLSALTQVGAGEVFAEESPHFTNEGDYLYQQKEHSQCFHKDVVRHWHSLHTQPIHRRWNKHSKFIVFYV